MQPGEDFQGMCLPRWPFSCVVSTRDGASRPTLFALIRVPLQWCIDSPSPFAKVRQFALSFSWRRVDSCSPFHGGASGLCQPSDGSTLPSRSPSRSGWIRTHIGDRPLRLGCQNASIGYSVGLRTSRMSCGGITPMRDSSQGIISFSCGWGGWCVLCDALPYQCWSWENRPWWW